MSHLYGDDTSCCYISKLGYAIILEIILLNKDDSGNYFAFSQKNISFNGRNFASL